MVPAMTTVKIPWRLRQAMRANRIMTVATRDAIVAAVACPNRKCGAKVGEPCRGLNMPHLRREQLWLRATAHGGSR